LKKKEKIAQAKLRGRIKHSATVKHLDFNERTELHKFHQKIAHLVGALAKRFRWRSRPKGRRKIAITQRSF
jgi:hypothetical protein